MKVKIGWMVVPALMLGLCVTGLLPGCSVGDPNDVGTVANGDFSGNYIGASNGLLVANNSGAPVSSLTVSQSGNSLQAVDNNGILFKGTIGDILSSSTNASSSESATFTLNGSTTAGNSVTITGKLSGVGSTATMTGLWVEPGLYSSIYGVAGITPIPISPSNNNSNTNSNSTALSISPTSVTVTNQIVTFTASGGTPPYTWTEANSNGTLSASSGPSVFYTRHAVGDNKVMLNDSASPGHSVTADITQP